jgi:hypothetical protein
MKTYPYQWTILGLSRTMSLIRGAFSCKGIPVYSFCHAREFSVKQLTCLTANRNTSDSLYQFH